MLVVEVVEIAEVECIVGLRWVVVVVVAVAVVLAAPDPKDLGRDLLAPVKVEGFELR